MQVHFPIAPLVQAFSLLLGVLRPDDILLNKPFIVDYVLVVHLVSAAGFDVKMWAVILSIFERAKDDSWIPRMRKGETAGMSDHIYMPGICPYHLTSVTL